MDKDNVYQIILEELVAFDKIRFEMGNQLRVEAKRLEALYEKEFGNNGKRESR